MQLADPKPRRWFEEWREPGEFYQAANSGLGRLSDENSISSPQHQYLRDAYYAGVFARVWRDDQGPCKVRLIPERQQFPDAQLRFQSGHPCLDIEVTIARKSGSRMFEEPRELRKEGFATVQSIEELEASAREAIPRVVREKAEKHYSGGKRISLLVITNGSLSAEEMACLTECWRDHFEAIYLLCGMDVVRAWPDLHVLRCKEPF